MSATAADRDDGRRSLLLLAITASLWTVVAVSVAYTVYRYGFDWARQSGDPWNYLAAGERLNAGHPLYALSPGDRPVILMPPYWSVPLLAPPPIAAFWRPLALLGDVSMYLWGLVGLIGVVVSTVFAVRRGALPLIAILAPSLTQIATSGNFSGFLLPMLIGAWLLRDRPWLVGGLIAAGAAVKLTPAVLVLWLMVTGRWRAVGATMVVGLAILAVSLIGAGPQAFIDWLAAVPTSRPAPEALATITGLPPIAMAALLAVPVVLFWRRDRWSFGAAVVATALATPALYFTALGLLAAVPVWGDRPGAAGMMAWRPPRLSGAARSVPRRSS